jgi:hypothetical protein
MVALDVASRRFLQNAAWSRMPPSRWSFIGVTVPQVTIGIESTVRVAQWIAEMHPGVVRVLVGSGEDLDQLTAIVTGQIAIH